MQESSKKNVLRVISAQDSIEDTEVSVAEPLQICGTQLLPLYSLHRVNTHILSYTDTSAPYTRSMKRLRNSCEKAVLYMYSNGAGGWRSGSWFRKYIRFNHFSFFASC
jgi:hypothetical protein